MNQENHAVPLNEAWRYSRRININMDTPEWVDADHIGIDVKNTELLLSLGGISTLLVNTKTRSEHSNSLPTIVGVDKHGGAVAGSMSSATKNRLYQTQNSSDATKFLHNTEWTDMTLTLHLDQFQQQLNDEKLSLKKAESWVPHLNNSLRDGIRQVGTNFLLTGHSSLGRIGASLIVGNSIFLDSFGISLAQFIAGKLNPHGFDAGEFLGNVMFESLWWTFFGLTVYGNKPEKNGKGYRFTLFPGFELDRAFLLQILGRTLPLIKFTE